MFLHKLKAVPIVLALFAAVALAGGLLPAADPKPEPKPPAAEPSPKQKPDERPKAGDTPAWKVRATLKGHTDEVLCLAFGMDQLVTAGKDGTLRLWDVNTGKEQLRCAYPSDEGLMKHIDFTPDGGHVLMNFGDQIGYWDTSKKTFPRAPIGGVTPLASVPGQDRHAVLLHNKELDKNVAIFRVPSFAAVGDNKDILGFGPSEFVGYFQHPAKVHGASLTQGGDILGVTTADKTIHLWTVATKKELAVCKGHTDVILALAFSADGKALASAGKDGTVRLWEVATGKELAVFEDHKGPVRSVAFSPDGKTLASGSDDKSVAVWDVKGDKRLAMLNGHANAVLHVAFSRDGKVIGSSSADKTARLWEENK